MTRRWSLISLITVLALALAFVVVQLVTWESPAEEASGGKPGPAQSGGAAALRGDGWWPLHGSGTARAGERDAVPNDLVGWTQDGPNGGALSLDGDGGAANVGIPVLDTAGKDYSVAARVRLGTDEGFRTAVSQDGPGISTFFLQYSAADERFAFSLPGSRTLAEKTGKPETGRWYHLVGTYSQDEKTMRIYVDGSPAGERKASAQPRKPGNLVIGRGRSGGRPADYWKGDIADVHVYERELTAAEVSALSSGEPE
ncbi:LamG domain-containing protein [Streptomyces cavernicola]|uniref:LamG domain-containing protein n=1 Tax=Streptomyces cavernicola TaxID=3043613 RepID=A0ABT6SC20_9ACTN|nr:LamG domain-containing protein [Streptomyces sp. B-S-A6]MDI3405736.1 LamG domain-containing protein [Streptomyces sp. B-S-A6]